MKKVTLLCSLLFTALVFGSIETEAARNCRSDNSCVRNGSNNSGARVDRDRNRNGSNNSGARADRDRNRNGSNNSGARADRDRNRNGSNNSGARADRDRNRNGSNNSGARADRDRNRNGSNNSGARVNRDRNRNGSNNSGARVNRDRRDSRDDARARAHRNYRHRPNWNSRNTRYTRYHHAPYRYDRTHHRRWSTNRSYHRTIPYRDIYWNNWLRVRVTWTNGYYWWDDYPWYSYNGYRHRYSRIDYCNYELVDGYNNTVERRFYNYTCNTGYDLCADLRDNLNSYEYGYRYFCSEKLDGDYTEYGYDYNDDFYSDVSYDDGYGRDDYDDWDNDFNDNW
ncbi:hypothetical protein [Halobacteriovorax sp. HLS]|uniref:hypothetical protein n=1 Tax=Halobacteriovorax sp. HLS TaxID=2234000 RepID=UPI000FD810CB|nr:hypothetical protein [Halobacteriovorax sp. HLS]